VFQVESCAKPNIGEQHQCVEVGMECPDPDAVVDTSMATCGVKRAVPSLDLGGDLQHQHVDIALETGRKQVKLKKRAVTQPPRKMNVNSVAVPNPEKTKKVERKVDFHLNWFQPLVAEDGEGRRKRRGGLSI
jgi:hypothetical protein